MFATAGLYNVVVTVRDWSDPKHYLHDLIVTDRRKPTVNGYGLIYGAAELSTDNLPVLDPVKNTKTTIKVPVKDPKYTPSSVLANPVLAPSPYWGTEQVWDSQVNAHNPMMDQDGRVYWTAQQRSPKDPPDYCKRTSSLRSAQLYPLAERHDPNGLCHDEAVDDLEPVAVDPRRLEPVRVLQPIARRARPRGRS